MNLLLWGVFTVLLQQPAVQAINFFSIQQDIEIGADASAEAEDILPLIREANLNRYFRAVGQRLAAVDSLPDFQYRFRIVNSREINSVGFPGGGIYVNRGLIEFASDENELAAILAHEMGHIASRHGTSQLSRQLLVQAPISIAAGLPTSEGWRDQLIKLGVSFGVRASFLRYSRDQELEASRMAVELLHHARFDPQALGTLLQKVNEAENTEDAHLPAYVFNHPQPDILPAELETSIERLATQKQQNPRNSGEFRAFHVALAKVAYPAVEERVTEDDGPSNATAETFSHPLEYFRFGYPKGWQLRLNAPNGAIVAPPDAVQVSRMRDGDITHGVIVDLFDFGTRQLTLEDATNRLIVHLRQRNQSLKVIPGAQTHTLISDEPGLRTVLVGKERVTDPQEVVWVVTRMYYQTLFYMIFVAPEDEFPAYQPVFEQIIRSTRLR